MKTKAFIMDEKSVKRALTRISHEIIERNRGIENLVVIGIKSRGVPMAKRIVNIIKDIEGEEVPFYSLDISKYRDDVNNVESININKDMDMDVKDKVVILVDDVLFTGRTVRAAMDAIIDQGRPRKIELAVLIDRGHRELPIRADFVGKNVPTSRNERVAVHIEELDGLNQVLIQE
jgi:pyrimidine operon attenuation protein/uracil phosphoribosyltransferase